MEIKRNLNVWTETRDLWGWEVSISYGDKEKFEQVLTSLALKNLPVSISYGDKEKFEPAAANNSCHSLSVVSISYGDKEKFERC